MSNLRDLIMYLRYGSTRNVNRDLIWHSMQHTAKILGVSIAVVKQIIDVKKPAEVGKSLKKRKKSTPFS